MNWKQHAACRNRTDVNWDADWLDPRAAAICGACPVRNDCLAEALERRQDDDVGIWGGMTPQERRLIRKGKADPCAIWAQQSIPYRSDQWMT